MDVLLWPRMQSSLFDPRVYHQGIPALVEEMLCALAFRGLWVWGSFLPCVNRPVVGLGTDDDFSLLASACRGHLVGVCLHGVSVDTVALAVAVVVHRLFIHRRPAKRRGATPLRVRRGFLRRRPPETHADQN